MKFPQRVYIEIPGLKVYAHHLGDYMRRWILQTPFGELQLHNILKPDADPHSRGSNAHRITGAAPNTWTVVVAGPRSREWGFLVDGEFVHFTRYTSKKEPTP